MNNKFSAAILSTAVNASAVLSTAVIVSVGLTSHALAQFTGPSSVPVMTVQQLLDQGKDDQKVMLRGHIVTNDGGDRYTFADETGKIQVEIDKRRLPVGKPFDDKQRVELVGEFDKDFRSTEVDVDEVRLVP